MTYLLAIGTRKGLFTATSEDRERWRLTGPHKMTDDDYTSMSEIYAVGINPHNGRLLASAMNWHYGASVSYSDDHGATWHEPESAPIAYPGDLPYRRMDFSDQPQGDQPDSKEKNALKRVWQLAFGPDENRVYAGAEPTALFVSDDGGQSFTFNHELWNHPHHDKWGSGGGGPAVHTIVPDRTDADRVTVAMSTGGVYFTEDGGRSWTAANHGIPFGGTPEEEPEAGQCVHKVTRGVDGAWYMQNHGGVLRSEHLTDGWTSIADDLPTDFGFAMVAHPKVAGTVLNFPVAADSNRFPPDHRIQVRRTEDRGKTWRSMSDGLPEEPYFANVLRDGACTDHASVPGFYFGTRCGDVFAATDDKQRWHQVASHLPDVLCVRAAEV